ncbi:MAG: hypothetical protein GXP22_09285 [Gammaproteobacteria bacterium]|nr:hypothetical protein [Gammaproteobacteria bacterium]
MSKSDLSIQDVTEIYILIKGIVDNSRRVYVVSMNAMLFSRNVAGMDAGFLMVSSQLRDFSKRLTSMMESMKGMMSTTVSEVALNLKLQRNLRLIEQTCRLSRIDYSFSGVDRFMQHRDIIERSRTRLASAARQLRLMTRLGMNLVVLARVESRVGGDAKGTLDSIIGEMEQAMVIVEQRISNVQKIVA